VENQSVFSRRRLLAGVPAFAVAVAPAVATPLGGLPTQPADDPIFVVIERHRQALKTYREANGQARQLIQAHEAQRHPEGVYLGEFPEIKTVWATEEIQPLITRSHLDVHRIPTGRTVPVFVRCPAHIEDHIPSFLTTPDQIESWKTKKREELDAWHAGEEGSALSAAQDLRSDAWDHVVEATVDLGTAPETVAGAVALLKYIVESFDANSNDDYAGDIWDILRFDDDDEDREGEPVVDTAALRLEILETIAGMVQSAAMLTEMRS
jgi:hypothetical protein